MAEREGWLAAALAQVRGVEFDEAAVRARMVRPESLLNARSDRGRAGAPAERAVHPPPFPVPVFFAFDAAGFIALLQDALAHTVAGYSIGLTENGSLIGQADQNWAKWPQDEPAEGWTPDTRMHVASLNKIVTAIAMTRLLPEAGLGPDTLIYDYLPGYWAKGLNIGLVTFGNLMAHTSGLAFNADSPPADIQYMKSQIAAGTCNINDYSYQNVNYGLLRVLLATVNDNVPVDWNVDPEMADALWDCATTAAYASYVASYVFAPASVTGPGFTHEAADALAYNFPVKGKGWNSSPSGELAHLAGADGYHMSVNELLRVMAAFRRGGTIVSTAQAQAMLEAGYGVNIPIVDTQLGPAYHKIGTWSNNGQWEQGVAFFLPLNMELVVLVNSPVDGHDGQQDGNFLYSVVSDAYLLSIVQIPRPSEP
jgi:CubicO group peptidase (beta-lactamase class C family)